MYSFVMTLLVTLAVQLHFSAPVAQAFPGMAGSGGGNSVKGKIAETMDVESYTYVKLNTKEGETWAAVPKTKVKVGQEVEISDAMPMENFESKALKRTFKKIMFGTLGGGKAMAAQGKGKEGKEAKEAKGNPHAGMGMGAMGSGASRLGPTPFSKDLKLAKADGAEGKTIAEIYAQKKELKGKPVAVRGKIVKYTGGVMGLNWIHMHDGSGKESEKNFDLSVATKETAKVGDVVVIKGTLTTDKDIGAGYFYPILVEKATVTQSK